MLPNMGGGAASDLLPVRPSLGILGDIRTAPTPVASVTTKLDAYVIIDPSLG